VDPQILVEYAWPIMALVLTILIGQGVLGSTGFLLSGQPLKTAMKCGFSMAQIGEFAFIIASLGLSLKVIGDFLYPVVVAVSVITTFLTPYMIHLAEPCYDRIERVLPKKWMRMVNHLSTSGTPTGGERNDWKSLLTALLGNVVVYSILSVAVITLMFTFFLPFVRHLLPHWWGNGVCGVLTALLISPFLRAMVMKKNHSEEFRNLWTASLLNRFPLLFTVVVRIAIAVSFIFYICNYLTRFTNALMISIAVAALLFMIFSRSLKHRSIMLERLFVQNLRSREIEAQVRGRKRPHFARNLLDRDIHISDIDVPDNSAWAGRQLNELQFRKRFGVHISSILRGKQRLNIPNGDTVVFPGDRLQAIGDDEQLRRFDEAMRNELIDEDYDLEKREMLLRQMTLASDSPFIGKTLSESGIRNKYNCMVVGVEEGQENLTMINPSRKFQKGDIIWVVGEAQSLSGLGLA
ncbi:MAG TPA: TrkA C-terminal domain-containing protein, partial [Prevotella sp.]